MSMVLGAIIILAIAFVLFLLFKKIFSKNAQGTKSEKEASDEVLGKEVSNFDTKTGDEKGTGNEGVQIEKSDDNKEIR
jgi:uncharacterized protein YpmB